MARDCSLWGLIGVARLRGTTGHDRQKRGRFAITRLHLDATVMRPNDLLDDVQAEPQTIAATGTAPFALLKRIENRRDDFRGNAARVDHLHLDVTCPAAI